MSDLFGLSLLIMTCYYFILYIKIQNIKNLYFASSGAHPGAGIPGVLSSAKVVENIILNE